MSELVRMYLEASTRKVFDGEGSLQAELDEQCGQVAEAILRSATPLPISMITDLTDLPTADAVMAKVNSIRRALGDPDSRDSHLQRRSARNLANPFRWGYVPVLFELATEVPGTDIGLYTHASRGQEKYAMLLHAFKASGNGFLTLDDIAQILFQEGQRDHRHKSNIPVEMGRFRAYLEQNGISANVETIRKRGYELQEDTNS